MLTISYHFDAVFASSSAKGQVTESAEALQVILPVLEMVPVTPVQVDTRFFNSETKRATDGFQVPTDAQSAMI